MAKKPKATKLKTHSGSKKRFKVTGSGKIVSDKSCNNHLLTNKGKNNKKTPYGKEVGETRIKGIKKLIPYK